MVSRWGYHDASTASHAFVIDRSWPQANVPGFPMAQQRHPPHLVYAHGWRLSGRRIRTSFARAASLPGAHREGGPSCRSSHSPRRVPTSIISDTTPRRCCATSGAAALADLRKHKIQIDRIPPPRSLRTRSSRLRGSACQAGRGAARDPLAGGTLLHLCVDYDEMEIARWLLAHGADMECEGGHQRRRTASVDTLRCLGRWSRSRSVCDGMTCSRACCWITAPTPTSGLRCAKNCEASTSRCTITRDVTPLGWGRGFHNQTFVSKPAVRLIAERGGRV